MARSYGLDYETGWDMAHDPQMRPAFSRCRVCGDEIYSEDDYYRNDGMCLPCYYKSLEPDPDDTELFEGETRETDSSTPLNSAQNDEKGGGEDGGKR